MHDAIEAFRADGWEAFIPVDSLITVDMGDGSTINHIELFIRKDDKMYKVKMNIVQDQETVDDRQSEFDATITELVRRARVTHDQRMKIT